MRKQENCCKKFYVADVPGVSFSREATYPAIPCFSKIDCEACPFYEEEKEEIPTPDPELQRLFELFGVKDLKTMRKKMKNMQNPLYRQDPRVIVEFFKKNKNFSSIEETLEFLGYNLSWYKEACKKYDELHLLD